MIIANQNAYINTETQEEVTPSIICGYRNMSTHTKAMSNCWIFEIVDQFGVYILSPTRQWKVVTMPKSLREKKKVIRSTFVKLMINK